MILNRSVETTTEQKCAPVNLGHVLLHRTFFLTKIGFLGMEFQRLYLKHEPSVETVALMDAFL